MADLPFRTYFAGQAKALGPYAMSELKSLNDESLTGGLVQGRITCWLDRLDRGLWEAQGVVQLFFLGFLFFGTTFFTSTSTIPLLFLQGFDARTETPEGFE